MLQDRRQERREMVESQIRNRGVGDPDVLRAMEAVPRHLFVPEKLSAEAYLDRPLPIGHGQTISQPYIVAWMTELLAPVAGCTVLEIGAGSGYQAAVLAEMGATVISIERIGVVAELARSNLHRAGYDGVTVILADGTIGWRENSPYSRILITAGAPKIPSPLMDQLEIGGWLIAPVGPAYVQEIVRLTRAPSGYQEEHLGGVRFVPLIGEYGWKNDNFEL
jgi:protein-L-isoaspartate(D-aspartate) O-methyltransferase